MPEPRSENNEEEVKVNEQPVRPPPSSGLEQDIEDAYTLVNYTKD